MSPEVLIYVQKLKTYFENNIEAKEYFLTDSDEEFFYTQLQTISNKNFIKNGDPQLSMDQLELIRRMSIVVNTSKNRIQNLYMDMGEFGKIWYN